MNLLQDTSLTHYTTMHLGGPAKLIAEINTEQELSEAITYARANNLKFLVLGQGSNIVFGDAGFDGLILLMKIPGLLIDGFTGLVRVGAGTNWHEVVTRTVEAGLVGIEALAFIPGTCGATPVNNIGAYGQEIKNTLQSVHAYDTQTNMFVELSNADCQLSYRNSIFKGEQYGRYIISAVTFQLQFAGSDYEAPKYPALQAAMNSHDIYYPTAEDVMNTVIEMRNEKLPSPSRLPNTGSFFKNPLVSQEQLLQLQVASPDIPHFPQPDGREKLAAGWLIEAAGLKNFREDGIWVYDRQALVLVNEGATSFTSLQNMITKIQQAVFNKFAITLEPEPEIFA
jgi:UDP-N-acetylmuramate dehydrogenase